MNNLEPDWGSEASIIKCQKLFQDLAKEPISVSYIKGAYYAFGSELACLRLLKEYRNNEKARQGLSKEGCYNSFYFALEVN